MLVIRCCARFANAQGQPANHVETEQIVHDASNQDHKSGCGKYPAVLMRHVAYPSSSLLSARLIGGRDLKSYQYYHFVRHFTSFLQMRASIPCFWSQDLSTKIKPPVIIDRRDPFASAASLHFVSKHTIFDPTTARRPTHHAYTDSPVVSLSLARPSSRPFALSLPPSLSYLLFLFSPALFLFSLFLLHVQDALLKKYGGPIIVLDLVKKKEKRPRESILSAELADAINYLNQFVRHLRHCFFVTDFSARCPPEPPTRAV